MIRLWIALWLVSSAALAQSVPVQPAPPVNVPVSVCTAVTGFTLVAAATVTHVVVVDQACRPIAPGAVVWSQSGAPITIAVSGTGFNFSAPSGSSGSTTATANVNLSGVVFLAFLLQ